MKLTQKQWKWLQNAPQLLIAEDGTRYEFKQGKDACGKPIVHFTFNGNTYVSQQFSPELELHEMFRGMLYDAWEVWNNVINDTEKVIHLTTRDVISRYRLLDVDVINISHTKLAYDKVLSADRIVLHHNGKSKTLKNRYPI